MVIDDIQKDSFEVIMPVWIPGSYMVREFSRQVEGFNAQSADGKSLTSYKVRKNRWRVVSKGAKQISVSYLVYSFELSVRTNYVIDEFAFMNGAALFMYTEESRNLPSKIKFVPWKGWEKISSALPLSASDKWIRLAENFDRIADSPTVIGNHDEITFDYKGIPHHVAMIGKAKYDREKISKDLFKVVVESTKIFGENPNKDYTFFVINGSTGGGGLEHLNSTSIMVARTCYESENDYIGFLNLAAHEYFHLWNVKRIRPVELGPFDYENEVYTRQIWFFEGFTSFYDDYIIHKMGLNSDQDYIESVKGNIQSIINTPGSGYQSLAEASFDAWIKYYRQTENSKNSSISYYTKGGVVAAMLNLDILNSTNGEKSLNDVMHYLYHEHFKKLNRGLTDAELQNAFEKVSGKSYDDFFRRYVFGTEPLPYEEFLSYAGISLIRKDGMKEPMGYLGATFNPVGNRLLISYVERNSAAWEQGLYVNDEILNVDGKEPLQIKDYLTSKKPGDPISIRLTRMGLPKDITIHLGEPTQVEFEISKIQKPTKGQKIIYEKWISAQ